MFSADILDNEGNFIRTLNRGTFNVIEIVKEINGADSAEFRVPSFVGVGGSRQQNPVLDDLSVRQNGVRKVNIYTSPDDNVFNRKLLFSGFIFTTVLSTIEVAYQCVGIQSYLLRKHINQNTDYTTGTDTVIDILSAEWNKINARYPTGIVLNSTDTTTTTAEVKRGEKFGQLIERMSDLGLEYKYEYPTITIEPVIGNTIAKSLKYNFSSTAASNILPPDRVDEDASLLGNSCYGKTDSGDAFFSNVPATQEEITIFKNFSDGDAAVKAEEYVTNYSQGEEEYEIILDNTKWALDEIDAGDFVNLNIKRGFTPMDIIGQSRVVRKRISFEDAGIVHSVSVSNAPLQENVTDDILKRLKTLEDLV